MGFGSEGWTGKNVGETATLSSRFDPRKKQSDILKSVSRCAPILFATTGKETQKAGCLTTTGVFRLTADSNHPMAMATRTGGGRCH